LYEVASRACRTELRRRLEVDLMRAYDGLLSPSPVKGEEIGGVGEGMSLAVELASTGMTSVLKVGRLCE